MKGKKNKKKKKKKKDVKLYTHTVHAMEGKLTLLDFTVHEEVSSVLVYSRTPLPLHKIASWDRWIVDNPHFSILSPLL